MTLPKVAEMRICIEERWSVKMSSDFVHWSSITFYTLVCPSLGK